MDPRRRASAIEPTVGTLPISLIGCSVDRVENDLWEKGAAWWQRNYTEGADPEYEEQILPLVEHYARGAQRVLDIGCGEGQVARRLASQGAEVVGLDVTDSQILAARAAEEDFQGTCKLLPIGFRVVTLRSTQSCCAWRSNTWCFSRMPFRKLPEC